MRRVGSGVLRPRAAQGRCRKGEEDYVRVASLITTCMGRLEHLKLTLPSMLNQQTDAAYEVLVVCYNDPVAWAWVKTVQASNLRAVRVETEPRYWNMAHARNCGAAAARGWALAFVDADVLLTEHWLQTVVQELRQGRVAVRNAPRGVGKRPDHGGTHAIRAEVYEAVRGNDEKASEHGWMNEDGDTLARCSRWGYVGEYDNRLVYAMPHGDAARTANYREPDKEKSKAAGAEYLRTRRGPVNPEGWGGGIVELWEAEA